MLTFFFKKKKRSDAKFSSQSQKHTFNFFPRLFWDFQKWTKKMSKIENPKYFWEKEIVKNNKLKKGLKENHRVFIDFQTSEKECYLLNKIIYLINSIIY
jgi:hypothetical protein